MQIDLFKKIPLLKKLVKLRSFQFLVIFPNLVLFYFFLLAGVFGSPVGNRNIIIVFVWILWWFALITFMVPFASRIWCAVCPFPFFGEWFQRRRLIGVAVGKPGVGRNRMWGLNKR
ncbi:MAG: 4Fe-4S binding protein, partial [Omnitrophica bacterium]|nr:4Fe-4S binding protein [Candidatus Omnitrophota bacterium]